MTLKVYVLDLAKDDFREIRKSVQARFGDKEWNKLNQKFKDAFVAVGKFPLSGMVIEEMLETGWSQFRQILVGKTRVIYQISKDGIYVHMFVTTERDFSSALTKRLLYI